MCFFFCESFFYFFFFYIFFFFFKIIMNVTNMFPFIDRPVNEGKKQARSHNGFFKKCTLQFLENCSKSPTNEMHNITSTSLTFGSQRRRFYDVLSILESFGICTKVNSDSFIWNGYGRTKEVILALARNRGVFDHNRDLNSIVSSEGCISIPRLAEDFILCYLSLETNVLNIILVSEFMSRNNHRNKTTRCKLYQVACILELIGLIHKSNNQSEFILDGKYFVSATMQMTPSELNPSSFENLLNRAVPSITNPIIKQRREYFNFFSQPKMQQTPPEV